MGIVDTKARFYHLKLLSKTKKNNFNKIHLHLYVNAGSNVSVIFEKAIPDRTKWKNEVITSKPKFLNHEKGVLSIGGPKNSSVAPSNIV